MGGIAAGLALLSGPDVLIGLLGLGIAYGIACLLGFFKDDELFPGEQTSEDPERSPTRDWRTVLLFGGGTVLLVGTLFFLYPQGLGAWAASLSTFLQGWMRPSSIPFGRLLSAIVFYAVLALVFGLAAGALLVMGFLKAMFNWIEDLRRAK